MAINVRRFSKPAPVVKPDGDGADGILLIDKPAGISSHDVVNGIRRKFNFRKVGHGGTLDPGATGLLLILVGKGTSLSERVMGCDKKYSGEIVLGVETTTQDLEGEIVSQLPWDLVDENRLRAAMSGLVGDTYQIPPMVSALKVNGVPLYKLARKGQVVERKARLIHVYSFKLTEFTAPTGKFEVKCGKGVYVRTLCHDVGQNVGCGACMKSLRRLECGEFRVADATPFDVAKEMQREELLGKIIPIHKIAGQT